MRRLVLIPLLAAAVAVTPVAVQAQEPPDGDSAAPAEDTAPGSDTLTYVDAPPGGAVISEGYGNVSVAQAEVDAARETVRVMSAAVADAEIVLADARATQTRTQVDVDSVQRTLDAVNVASGDIAGELIDARRRVDRMAAAAYVSGGLRPGRLEAVLSASDPAQAGRRQVLLVAAGDDQISQVDELVAIRDSADVEVVAAVDLLAVAQGRLRQAEMNVEIAQASRDAAVEAMKGAEARLDAATELLGSARTSLLALAPSATLDTVDIPILAVDAYVRAADWAKRTFAGCTIEWYAIAGIARQESNHGRYGGSKVMADGEVVPHIIGIALDGTRSLAIADTDGGVLDGDPVWDRAIGPTQFIPTTWRSYAARFDLDGNGDGRADPHNIYDQSRATATLLCRNGWNEADPDAQWRALYSYNPSVDYVTKVTDWISGYRTVSLPDLSLVSPLITPPPPVPPPVIPNPVITTPPVEPDPDDPANTTVPPTTIDPPARPPETTAPPTTQPPTTTVPPATTVATTIPPATTTTTTVPPATTVPPTSTTTSTTVAPTTVPATTEPDTSEPTADSAPGDDS